MRIPEQVKRVANAIFEAATGCAFFWVGVQFYLNPSDTLVHSPIGQTIVPVDYLWNVFYIAGGAATFIGLTAPSRRTELGGLIVLSTGLLVNAIALAFLNPQLRMIGYLGFATACTVTAWRRWRQLDGGIAGADNHVSRGD